MSVCVKESKIWRNIEYKENFLPESQENLLPVLYRASSFSHHSVATVAVATASYLWAAAAAVKESNN